MTRFNAPSYDIARPTGRCAFSDRELLPGEAYYATLVDLTDDELTGLPPQERAKNLLGLKRLDVCPEIWQQGHRPDRLFGFWKTTVPELHQKRRLFVDDAILMNLLHRLADATEPQRIAFRYVLALILMRKKLLRYDGSERRQDLVNGQAIHREWWKLTPKLDLSKGPLGKWNENDSIEVFDPKLEESDIEEVTNQLAEILEAEL